MKVVLAEAQQADVSAIQSVAAASWHATYEQIDAQDYIDCFLAARMAQKHSVSALPAAMRSFWLPKLMSRLLVSIR